MRQLARLVPERNELSEKTVSFFSSTDNFIGAETTYLIR